MAQAGSSAQALKAGEQPVVVAVPAALKRRLDLLIQICPKEISGLGEVEVQDGVLTVTALHLLKQEVTSDKTDLDTDAVLAFMATALERGIDLEKVRLWWHSHADGGLFWSPTDEKNINDFDLAPWWVSIEGNHAGEYIARLDIFPTDELPVRITHRAVLQTKAVEEELAAVKAEIKAYVREAPKPKKKKATSRPKKTVAA